jgi:TolB-like protein
MMGRLALVALLLGGAVSPLPAQATSATVAVLPFRDGGSYGQDRENFDALEVAIPALLRDLLGSGGGRVLSRDAIAAALPDSGGRLDAAAAAEVGRRVGARYVVTGSFMDHYGRFRIDARIVDVDRAAIIAVVSNDPALQDRRQLFEMIRTVAQGVARKLELAAPASPGHAIPSDAITWYGRGLRSRDQGDKQAASGFFRRALEADANFVQARAALRAAGSP